MSKVVYRRNGVLISEKTGAQTQQEKEHRAKELARLEEEYKRTHPEGVERVSGCCDSAENY